MISAATSMPQIATPSRPTRPHTRRFGDEQEEHDDGEDKEYPARG